MAIRRIRVDAWFDGFALHAKGPYLITAADGVIASIAQTTADTADMQAPFAMPGLCDAHVHLFLDGSRLDPAERNAQIHSGRPAMLSVARANIDRSLRAGVTLLRDAGDAFGINHAIRRELGARSGGNVALRSSGAGLRRAGRYGRLLAREIDEPGNIAQAVDAAAETADDIKVVLTDIVDFETGRMKGPPQFSLDEMRLLVARAHRHGRRTFVHCSGADGLAIAVGAKVDSIEHGYFMNREILKRMADARIAWVPTFAPVCFQLARPEIAGWSKTAIANLDLILRSHAEHVVLAYELGVPILAGSDAGSPGVPHGSGLIDELQHMREAGLPIEAVMQSATGEARRHWGMADAALAPGQQADLVLLDASPFRDPGALRDVLAVVEGDAIFNASADNSAPRYRPRPQEIADTSPA